MKTILRLAVGVSLLSTTAWATPSKCPWMFFDLGMNSLVQTLDTPEHPFGSPGSVSFVKGDAANGNGFDYIEGLAAQGFTLGLIVNFPDEYPGTGSDPWNGAIKYDPSKAQDPAYRRLTKREFVKKLIKNAWDHGSRPPMKSDQDWNEFWALFEGRFLIPSFDTERKDKSPQLFQEAMKMAKDAGCNAVYSSASPKELKLLQTLAVANKGAIAPFFEGRWAAPDYYLAGSAAGAYKTTTTWKTPIPIP